MKIVLTRSIHDNGVDILRRHASSLTINPHNRPWTREELIEAARDANGLLCMLSDRIDDPLMALLPALRAISTHAVGVDNIDLEAARRRGIAVCNTPGVLTDATADLAFALILACARRIVEADGTIRTGGFKGWGPLFLLGTDLHGKTLGVVGAGRIGRAVARRSSGFEMNILYASRSASPEIERESRALRVGLDDLLRRSDFVSLNCPLTPETDHMIGAKELSLMKPSAFLINTARGRLVVEEELVLALREGRIAGAGLDVYEEEPKVHPGLLEMKNVVLIPHLGSATRETRGKMAEIAATNLVNVLQGEKPLYRVV